MAPCANVSSSSSGGVSRRMTRISLERKLPCQHNALCAELMPRGRAGGVRDADLRGNVQLTVRGLALRHAEHAEVRKDECVNAAVVQQAQVCRERGKLVPARHGVDRDMHTHTVCMGKATASGSSSGEKFPAKERMPKLVPAR